MLTAHHKKRHLSEKMYTAFLTHTFPLTFQRAPLTCTYSSSSEFCVEEISCVNSRLSQKSSINFEPCRARKTDISLKTSQLHIFPQHKIDEARRVCLATRFMSRQPGALRVQNTQELHKKPKRKQGTGL